MTATKPGWRSSLLLAPVAFAFLVGMSPAAEAARDGNRGGARATGKTSVNRPAPSRSAGANHNSNVNRNSNRNVNRNSSHSVSVDRDIDIDVDVDHHGYHGYHDDWNDWDDHPVATAAAVTATVAVTSAVIGSIVNDVPSGCVTNVINGIAYQQCGSTWYQPQYAGTQVQYIVVNNPY